MKVLRIVYIILSALIITLTLAVSQVVTFLTEERDELIRQLDTLTRLLTEAKDEKDRLQNQLNCRELLSRGGRVMDIMTPSGMSEEDMETALKGTGLEGIGEVLVQAEEATSINAVVLAAIIVHETGWGQSRLARKKNNMAGLGAYDGCEYSAGIRFDSRADSIMYLARLLATHYAPGGKHFGGSHDLQGIGARYASDPRWAEKVAGCMRTIIQRTEVKN